MGVNVTELMARIRESAARKKLEVPVDGTRFTLAQLRDRSNLKFDLPELTLSPEFSTRRNNHYHVNELLQFHDREFVRNAYRAVLKREPDEPGLNSFVQHLRSGRQNKIDILTRLRYSSEGRQRNVRIDGLLLPALVRSPTRVPVLGYVYEWLIGLVRLPIAIRHHRQFEAHVMAQHQQIADHLNRLTKTVRSLEQFIEESRQEVMAQHQDLIGLQETVANHDGDIMDLSRRNQDVQERLSQSDRVLASHSESLQQFRAELNTQRVELSGQWARFASLTAQDRAAAPSTEDSTHVSVYDQESLNAVLLSIEDRFRGERDDLKQRFSFYLPYLERENIKTSILDVGCGRGEWLELLTDAGFTAEGIDSNRLMIEQCKAAGLKVTLANIRDYLADRPERSLKAITAFHVVEHLGFADLLEFIDQSIRTLQSGGLLILETPNPDNVIVSTRNFYLDPSHVRPLPSELLQFLLTSRGLTNVEVVGLHPLAAARVEGETEIAGRVNDLFYGPMDYCVIARRT